MPQRNGRILGIMQLRRVRAEIAQLKVRAIIVKHHSPSLGVVLATMFDVLARACNVMLEEMMVKWNPQAPPACLGRSAESFSNDELGACLRFD